MLRASHFILSVFYTELCVLLLVYIAISSNSHAQILKSYTHGHFCFYHLIWNFAIRNFATETCTYLQILYERLFSSLSPNWEDIGVSAVHKLTGLNYVSTYEQKL